MEAVLANIGTEHLSACGVVLEENLTAVTTYSVGRVRVNDILATYCGTQSVTRDLGGGDVYAGSWHRIEATGFPLRLSLLDTLLA